VPSGIVIHWNVKDNKSISYIDNLGFMYVSL